MVGVIGVVAEGCRRLCWAKSGGGSSERSGVRLVDLDADAGGVGPDADAGGAMDRVGGGPATAPAEGGGASEDKEAGGAVEGEIRCACSGHGGGGGVTFAEVSWRLGKEKKGGGFGVVVFMADVLCCF